MTTPTRSLLEELRRIEDPRFARGVRYPFAGLIGLVLLALICRQTDFAAMARWIKHHWAKLAGPLGIDRPEAPHQTTLSRAAERLSVAEFRAAMLAWLARVLAEPDGVAAVDGKTSKQAYTRNGPLHMVNVFLHEARLTLADWPVGEPQGTEPAVLEARLGRLLESYPALRVLTGDAAYCQRPLARAIIAAGRDYLLAIKENQPELLEATRTALSQPEREPDTEAVEKKTRHRGEAAAMGRGRGRRVRAVGVGVSRAAGAVAAGHREAGPGA